MKDTEEIRRATRREFIRGSSLAAGWVVVTASSLALPGCAVPQAREGGDSRYAFPQGVASADPQADAVVLWTRVVPDEPTRREVRLLLEVARDQALAEVVARREIKAEHDWDFTVRVFLQGLEPDRHYFYRFTAADGTSSRVGRTRTAPAADVEAELRLAVVSCQHYETGYFHAYRRLLDEDDRAPVNA